MPFLFLGLVLAGALSSERAPQTVGQPTRVSGRVVEDGTNAPLAGATITLIALERPAVASFPGAPPPQAVADQDGRFAFDGLAPGRYRIGAQKAGFASAPPPDPSALRTFELAEGQTLIDVNISLQRGAVITGQVLDPSSGEPSIGSFVMAMRQLDEVGARAPAGPPRLMPAGQSTQTNDLGEFRIFGLPPGEYFVVAGSSPNFVFAAGSNSIGGVSSVAAPLPTRTVMTFYPGTADSSAALPVMAAAGQVASGIVIRLVTAQTYQVSGTVVDENGMPVAGAMVVLRADLRSGFGAMPAGEGRSDAGGTFVIGGVTPGSYLATANVSTTTGSQSLSAAGIGAELITLSRLPGGNQANITVTDADVDGVQIVVQPR